MEGKTALKYFMAVQKYIRLSNGREYVFIPKNNISLAWIDNNDVNTVLSMTRGCNCNGGNTRTRIFFPVQPHDVPRWEGTV